MVTTAACTPQGGHEERAADAEEIPAFLPGGEGTAEEIDSFTLGMLGSANSLNPALAAAAAGWVIPQAVLEPLVKVNHQGELELVLAESVEKVDLTTIDVRIRDDVTFWDGTPLTPEDVVYSIDLNRAEGAARSGRLTAIESATVTGSDSVRIKLSTPQPEISYWLAMVLVISKAHAEGAGDTLGTSRGLVMGTGPYEVEDFSPTDGATLVRNEEYWGAKPSARTVVVEYFADEQALRLAAQSGQIDGTLDVPSGDLPAWEAISDVNIGIALSANPDPFLVFDTTQPPFDDIHARRALAALVDRAGIIDAVYGGYAVPAKSISSPSLWGDFVPDPSDVEEFMNSLPLPDYDLENAAEELAQSATPEGFSVTLMTPDDTEAYASVGQILKESGSEIGIDITVRRVTAAEWLESWNADDRVPLGIIGWSSSAPTPLVVPLGQLRPVPSPWSSYDSPALDAAFDGYLNSEHPSEQAEFAKEVLTELAEQVAFVPIAFPVVTYALSDKFVFADGWSGWKFYGGNNWAASIKVAE